MRSRVALFALAALVGAACESTTAPDGGLSVSTAGPSQLRPGQATTVTVTVTNNGASAAEVVVDGACGWPFTVTTRDGANVPLPALVCPAVVVPPRTLRPGESAAIIRDWDGRVAGGSTLAGGAPIAPGQYVLQGFVRTADNRVVTGTSVNLTVAP